MLRAIFQGLFIGALSLTIVLTLTALLASIMPTTGEIEQFIMNTGLVR